MKCSYFIDFSKSFHKEMIVVGWMTLLTDNRVSSAPLYMKHFGSGRTRI